MRILLDTHILIWFIYGNQKLSPDAVKTIQDPHNEIFYSIASLWEIAIKHRVKKNVFPFTSNEILSFAEHCNFHRLSIRDLNVLEYEKLPELHTDPFDNMLIAQARSEGMQLMTHDHKLEQFGSDVIMV
ncbi:type II toxin-antitoxin system VapC family toxin [Treponema sp.]|uniref:type II toxin-antitoxin system VapC family toxin n=1 Tax=Treponema sp. TaxID=166 RepID=UPI00298E9009|nr:type II toxin-antitoxin system VapC family toxin [Treponema sp.]MCQ2241512.1 type II toxin-antitoxin system VapC family toxin [Treponema sp.]